MRTIYPIGSKGFTLLEILLTLSIFTLGFSRLFLMFFESSSAVRHVGNRLSAAVFIENAVWEAGEARSLVSPEGVYRYAKTEVNGPQYFDISVVARKVSGFRSLYKLEAEAFWREGKKAVSLKKERFIKRP